MKFVRTTKEKDDSNSIEHYEKNLEKIGMIEDFLYNLSYQPFYWKRFGVALRSWYFRMITLTDEDLKNKVPNFWNAINEGHIDMAYAT